MGTRFWGIKKKPPRGGLGVVGLGLGQARPKTSSQEVEEASAAI